MSKEKLRKGNCWIIGLGNDDFKFHPTQESIKKVEKHNKDVTKDRRGFLRYKMYKSKAACQRACDKGNSI